MEPYHTGRRLAIVCGLAATAGAISLLLADAISSGHWTQDHALVPLVVGLTVATGYLASAALGSGRYLAAIGFSVAFAVGTTVTVLGGIGRQSEGLDAKMAAAESHNDAVRSKTSELDRARLRFDQANAQADREMTGSRCGHRCNDWKLRAKEVAARIREIEAEVARLGAVRPINAKAAKVGEIASALGLDGKRAAALVMLLEPLLVPFLLEWTAIAALGYGFHHRPARVPTFAAPATVAGPPPGGPGKRRKLSENEATRALPANVIQIGVRKPDIVSALENAGKPQTVSELAERMGVSRGECSKRWREAGKLVMAQRDGRNVVISLARRAVA